ncbi:hypothetical protein C1645_750559 [Glomus cerebriforme]|uniref:Ubiquitin-like domain-containing protein n=1 Tax=Glomus cerebriforme TaxID=658196 RepID=A0A397TLF8_9GLOM|nr:hypothetical protein C1645_750559 [Glomus cerebriforme]
MSKLALVAAALSSIINCPVKTYDECVANGLEISPNQILDLDIVHKYSFVREGDDEVVQKPAFRQGDEEVEKVVQEISRQDGEKDEKVAHRRSRQSGKDEKVTNRRSYRQQGDEKVVHRRSFVSRQNNVQANPDTKILPPQPIQIFFKTSFGKSHSMFVTPNSTVLELKQAIQAKLYIDRPIRLGFSSKILNDRKTLESYNIKRGDTIHVLFRMLGGAEYYVISDEFLNPQFDYDFTDLEDDGTIYTRGNEIYKRPYGWDRIALNVTKHGTDEWLGSVGTTSNEWPVSYHGTEKEFANSIADKGFLLSEGMNFYYGKGIYSTPEIWIAESYASEFLYEDVYHKVVFQNRVNPADLKKVGLTGRPYWLTPDDRNIRPYALCIKKV